MVQNMVNIAESTVGRRYAGWFIKNTERTQKMLDDLRHAPLPIAKKPEGAQSAQQQQQQQQQQQGQGQQKQRGGQKVAWGAKA